MNTRDSEAADQSAELGLETPDDEPGPDGTFIGDLIKAMAGRPIEWRGPLPYVPLHAETRLMLVDYLTYEEGSDEFEAVVFEIGNVFASLPSFERHFSRVGLVKTSVRKEEVKTLHDRASSLLDALTSTTPAVEIDLAQFGFSRSDQQYSALTSASSPVVGELGFDSMQKLRSWSERPSHNVVSITPGSELLPFIELVRKLISSCERAEEYLTRPGGGRSTRGRDILLFRLTEIFKRHYRLGQEANLPEERCHFVNECLKTVGATITKDALRKALGRVRRG